MLFLRIRGACRREDAFNSSNLIHVGGKRLAARGRWMDGLDGGFDS